MKYETTLDFTAPIKASMHEIEHTLIEAIILVLIVVYLFLQSFRATIIPMLTVPVSLLGAFIAFPLLGFSVNTLTLFGLVLAIGIVVDDAIVVVEAVQHHLEHGLSPREATVQAMKEVSGPVIMIALILCAVFVPVAFMGGVTGQLYQQFAITVAVAVVFSAINALTLSPALCAILLKKPKPARGPLGWFFGQFNRAFDRVTSGYGGVVNFLIRKAGRSILLLVVVVGAIWLLSKSVPGGFIPDEDKGLLFVAVELPEGASLQRSDEVLKKAEKIVAETKGVRSVCAISGYNILTGLNMSNSALMFRRARRLEKTESARAACRCDYASVESEILRLSRGTHLRLRSTSAPWLRKRRGVYLATAGSLGRLGRQPGVAGAAICCRSVQTAGDRALNDDVPADYAAVEHSARPGKSAGRRREG